MFDGVDGTIDSSSTDWVLTYNNGSIGWYRLPENAFNNTTYGVATTSVNGLMSSAMVSKMSELDNAVISATQPSNPSTGYTMWYKVLSTE